MKKFFLILSLVLFNKIILAMDFPSGREIQFNMSPPLKPANDPSAEASPMPLPPQELMAPSMNEIIASNFVLILHSTNGKQFYCYFQQAINPNPILIKLSFISKLGIYSFANEEINKELKQSMLNSLKTADFVAKFAKYLTVLTTPKTIPYFSQRQHIMPFIEILNYLIEGNPELKNKLEIFCNQFQIN